MYLHVGESEILRTDDIVAIFDHEKLLGSRENTLLVESLRQSRKITVISEKRPKSIIFTTKEVVISPISVLTLTRRLESGSIDSASDTEA